MLFIYSIHIIQVWLICLCSNMVSFLLGVKKSLGHAQMGLL